MKPQRLADLNDADLRRWRACARWFWLRRHRGVGAPMPASDAPQEADVVDGPAVAEALRAHWPHGRGVAAPLGEAGWAAAVAQTRAALDDHEASLREGWALFGACLASDDGTRVRVDVIARGAHGWRLFKLRWATVAPQADVDSMALAAQVAAHVGLRVASVGVLLVDTGFVYPGHGCYAGLLREVDLGPVLGACAVADWLVAMRACDRGPMPAVPLGAPCAQDGGCDVRHACGLATGPAGVADAGTRLEIVGRERAAELRTLGHADLRSVPLEALAAPRHRRAARAVQAGAPVFEPEFATPIPATGPCHWLRFETIGFAVPVWAGTQPYQVLPFQWSCDTRQTDGRVVHRGFLAEAAGGDPRRAFSESLVLALASEGQDGPIYAYNAGFERNRLSELARRFDDLAPGLQDVQARIVDLFQWLRACYYHPAMQGSWSARSVFRAIAPDLQAHGFEAPSPGLGTPLQAYAAALQRGIPGPRVQALREALQVHGRRQTAALRRITALADGQR